MQTPQGRGNGKGSPMTGVIAGTGFPQAIAIRGGDSVGRMGRSVGEDLVAASKGKDGESDDDILDRLAEKLAPKLGGGGGRKPNRPKELLGLDSGEWTKWILSLAVAATLGLAGWYLFVNDELKGMQHYIDLDQRTQAQHETDSASHPPMAKRLDKLEDRASAVEKMQTKMVETDLHQTELLNEIKTDVKQLRRRR